MTGDPDREQIATRWLIEQHNPEFSDERRDELARWLVSNIDNCIAYVKLVRAWRRLSLLRRGQLPMPYGSRPYVREKPGSPHRKKVLVAAGDPALVTRAFGKALGDHRRARQMTQKALATRTKLAASYISKLESGRASPSLGSIALLARALGMMPSELLDDFERVLEAMKKG